MTSTLTKCKSYKKIKKFDSIPVDTSWSFLDKTQKDTNYITHSYYTYPAKFIPQLASRLILEHSKPNDIVVDPFMGSGTTMVESIVNCRKCTGADINEVAYLATKVKITPLNIDVLQKTYIELQEKIYYCNFIFESYVNTSAIHEKIDYWFKPQSKAILSNILYYINDIVDRDVKDFFLLAFAQILKTASIWLQKSIKPTRDKHKKEVDIIKLFLQQSKKMIEKHKSYCSMLTSEMLSHIQHYVNIVCGDSRNLPLQNDSAKLIVTSPPYVTSYEYADLHQLPAIWLGYLQNLMDFRKKFIGSGFTKKITESHRNLKSENADIIIEKLGHIKKAKEVKCYYADMLESFREMYRILKPQGKACIVIGNTQFKGIDILNAEVFVEQMLNIGFSLYTIIHREIPSKMLPSTRDSSTGRFAKKNGTNKLVYPTEYIIIMEKQ